MSHEQKYLKYKQKYLQLKYILLGGSIHDWMRTTTNGWEEVHLIRGGKQDVGVINAEIRKIQDEVPLPALRQQRTRQIVLPSGRHLIIHYTDHEDGNRIDRLEYNGASIKSELKKGLDKLFDFIQFAVGLNGSNFFKNNAKAIDYITQHYSAIRAQFNTYVNKPNLSEIIAYIQSHPNIQNIRV